MPEQETLKRPEISPLIQPQIDPGGKLQPISWLNDTRIILRPDDRISHLVEPQRTQEIPVAPGLGRNSILEKTDWNSELEITTLFKNYNRYTKEGKAPQEALQFSLEEVEANIRTFTLEFIQARLVIPFLVSLDSSSEYSILSKYDSRPIVYKTSEQERLGGNKEAMIKVDAFMRDAPVGSVAITNSSPGETGWFDSQGKKIIYDDNQMTFYVKDENSFYAFTIVSDLNYDQSRSYSIGFGIDEVRLNGSTEMERVSNLVRNPILLSRPQSGQSPVDDAINRILAIRGTGMIRIKKKDGIPEYKPVSELVEGIKNRENMLNFCEEAEQVISQLRVFVFSQIDQLGDFSIQETISEVVDKAILEITRINRPKSSKTEIRKVSPSSAVYFNKPTIASYTPDVAEWMQRDYRGEIAYLENQKGCAGGSRMGTFSIGSSAVVSFGGVSSSGSRIFSFGSTSLESSKKGKTCVGCGEVNYCTKDCYKCGGMLI
ncbi:hypothetical protein HYS92_02800 [Candidatus Daviesbacteria bacterium]|nr:hypothetical protein [Candidatus Daviesbacteria bacterium]